MNKYFIKIYGERNTGTNYLHKLIDSNFDCTILRGTVPSSFPLVSRRIVKDLYFHSTRRTNLGWKHSIPDLDLIKQYYELTDLRIICLIKNPYSFVLSLFNRPYHQIGPRQNSMLEFVNTPWQTVRRENLRKRTLESVVQLWNLKVRSYFHLKDSSLCPVTIVSYESVINDVESALIAVSNKLNISISRNRIENFNESTKKDHKDFNYYRNYYLKEEWRKEINREEVEAINHYLDLSLVESCNYNIVSY